MKKFNAILFAALTGFALTSCGEEGNDGDNNNASGNIVKSGEITANETWTTGNVYELAGRVTVTNGATLTIQPGVIVKARAGAAANASALLISREGKLMAKGSATQPIIFTTTADLIQPGQINSPNMDPELNGFWGGVIILGKAPISASQASVQIEGIPVSDQNGLYGGTESAHSSGEISFISIRHGGTNIGAGNEINGLTLGGVGSGTVINNVEVVGNQDDGIEWFGGSVSITNALVWNAGDDALDSDQDWVGTCDNFIVVNPGDRAMELDGPEGTSASGNNHTFSNGTVFMGGGSELIDFDNNTNVDINNVYFYGMDEEAPAVVSGYAGYFTAMSGTVSNLEVTLPTGITIGDVFVGFGAGIVTEVAANANTVGPQNENSFSWTWASQSGALASIGL